MKTRTQKMGVSPGHEPVDRRPGGPRGSSALRRQAAGSVRAAAPGLAASGRRTQLGWAVLVWLAVALPGGPALAVTLLVWPGSPNPTAPFADWSTAARTIQTAVDAAQAGDTVLVTNGVYASGTRVVYGLMANRVAVTKPVLVRSVNGPQVTVIQGSRTPGGTNGDGAVRCVYLAEGSVLSGFTITNGATRVSGDWQREQSGGGVWCASANAQITNCTLSGNAAYSYGGGAHAGTLLGCALTGNSAATGGGGADGAVLTQCILQANSASPDYGSGGGAFSATLTRCTLAANSAQVGGGADSCVLVTCTLTSNRVSSAGGGASGSVLNACTLIGNTAQDFGGGVEEGTLSYCALLGNSSVNTGGGAAGGVLNGCTLAGNSSGAGGGGYWATLNNCVLNGNFATTNGGGAAFGTLSNCTLVGNSAAGASGQGGGAYNLTLYNCILCYNQAQTGSNHFNSTLHSCCATPASGAPAGNITAEPLFVDRLHGNLRLQSNSPCINAGATSDAPGRTDLDGRPRIVDGQVDIGAYEYQGPGFSQFIPWLALYGLPTDGSADYADPDGDGLNNWQEWLSGTDPTDALSVFRLVQCTNGFSGRTVCWQSVPNRFYFVEHATNLAGPPGFQPLAYGIAGGPGITTYTDTNAQSAGPVFYRVGTQP